MVSPSTKYSLQSVGQLISCRDACLQFPVPVPFCNNFDFVVGNVGITFSRIGLGRFLFISSSPSF